MFFHKRRFLLVFYFVILEVHRATRRLQTQHHQQPGDVNVPSFPLAAAIRAVVDVHQVPERPEERYKPDTDSFSSFALGLRISRFRAAREFK